MSFTLSQALTSYDLKLYPSSDNLTALNIYPTSPTTHFDKVDDVALSPNDDTDYVYASTGSVPPIIDMYNLTNHTTETGTINYIKVISRARAYPVNQMASGEYRHKITCGTGNALSPNYAPLTTSYNEYSSFFPTRPADGLAWTWTDIDALRTGLSVSSPLCYGTLELILRPVSDDVVQCKKYPDTGNNFEKIYEETADDFTTFVYAGGGSGNLNLYDIYNLNDASAIGTIDSVVLYAKCHSSYISYPEYLAQLGITTHGGTYWKDAFSPATDWTLYSWTWTVNPNTTGAWTWTEINDLKANLRLKNFSAGAWVRCTQLYIVVNYTQNLYPEIRTTQQYVIVNYTPSPLTVSLLDPAEVTLSNARRSERFIFPDGTYCIGDYGRAGKKLSMKGTEVTTAITKMRQIQAMLENPSPVTISGLLDVNQDIAWRLNDFNYEYDSSGDHYDWDMELAAYDVVA